MNEITCREVMFDVIKAKCPLLFKELRYIECDIGWYSIIEKLSIVIESSLGRIDPQLFEQIYVVQIKQKFGELRYYMSRSTPFIQGAIELAEYMSRVTCEKCGKPSAGPTGVDGWVVTYCPQHLEEVKLERANRSRNL